MEIGTFLAAALALLLAPGPTNTLMALSGAERGVWATLRLIPVEILGYLAAVLPLAFLGRAAMAGWPWLEAGMTLAAAVWVMWLALRLWRREARGNMGATVDVRRVFVTTFLNPKALIFGLVLLPAPGAAGFGPMLGVFIALVAGVAVVWSFAGCLLAGGCGARMRMVQRAASVWLGFVSVSLLAGLAAG